MTAYNTLHYAVYVISNQKYDWKYVVLDLLRQENRQTYVFDPIFETLVTDYGLYSFLEWGWWCGGTPFIVEISWVVR